MCLGCHLHHIESFNQYGFYIAQECSGRTQHASEDPLWRTKKETSPKLAEAVPAESEQPKAEINDYDYGFSVATASKRDATF